MLSARPISVPSDNTTLMVRGALGFRKATTGKLGPPCLGPRAQLLSVQRQSRETAVITFAYTDFANVECFLPPVYVNGNGTVTQLDGGCFPSCTWRVTDVPYGSVVRILMRAECVERELKFVIPVDTQCRFPPTGLSLTAVGGTCLTFSWTADPTFAAGYEYTLQTPSGIVIRAGVTTDAQVTINDLDAETPYVFTLLGLCAPNVASPAVSLTALTAPPAQLGPRYVILDVVPVSATLADVTFRYDDYFCATDFGLPTYLNAPSGWAGSVQRLSPALPVVWRVTDVPYSTTAVLHITAVADSTCLCVAYPDLPLTRALSVVMPSPPPPSCAAVPLTGLSLTAAGATCLSFAWTPQPLFALGYDYQLLQGATVVTQGSVPNHDTGTLTLTGPPLLPATAYTFVLTGRCSTTTTGTPVSIPASTVAPCTPVLPPFAPSATNPVFTFAGDTVTATLTYGNYACVTTPVLSWATAPPAGTAITQLDADTWRVTGVPPGFTAQLVFTATPDASGCTCCYVTSTTPLTQPVTFTTPAEPSCNTRVLNPHPPAAAGATCLTFTWTGDYFAGGYQWLLVQGSTTVQTGTSPPTAASQTLNGLLPSTAYEFRIRGVCGPASYTDYRTADATTSASKVPALAPFVPTATDPTFAYNSGDTLATAYFTYPASSQTCVTNLVLTWTAAPPPGSVITQTGPSSWTITNIPVPSTANLTLSATGAGATCENGCDPSVATVTEPISFPVPLPAPPPASNAYYNLTVTNYAGPPSYFIQIGTLFAPTAADPVLQGAGPVTQTGSYLNQRSLHDQYAQRVVDGFIKYNAQSRKFGPTSAPYHLPFVAVYYGSSLDPTQQGLSVPFPKSGGFEAKLAYNYADSSSTINAPAPYDNFQYPPLLQFYKRLVTYNWNVLKGTSGYTSNTRLVQLATTLYGSKKPGEQWFFRAAIDGGGNIVTAAPTDPKTFASIVDGLTNDGNVNTNAKLAGWNCLERWFMYVAYCNQQLRKFINGGLIVTDDSVHTMTLADIGTTAGQLAPQFCQISAVTSDGEGNGFENTLYFDNPPPQPNDYYWAPWFPSITSAQCNAGIKALWNKWLNQTTTPPTPPPGGWPSQWTTVNLVAPAARADGTTFVIPCALSTTTTGVIKNMRVSDVGSADFDAVNAVFHEVYDTGGPPWRMLGAETASITNCVGGNAIAGVPFTAAVKADANPTSADQPYAQKPETFPGVWDNLVLAGTLCNNALVISGGALAPSNAALGVYTAYNNAANNPAPRMNTSAFDPWTYSANPWILTSAGAPNVDNAILGWALEGSRYDLYNGSWARAASAGAVDYSIVKQGASGADGGLLWTDLSTGLKGFVASIMKDVATPACAAGQVWMLSCQSGPFVRTLGVRASKRNVAGPVTPADLLTFNCPNSSLADDGWPGWQGMRGQYYGPGTDANANVLQRWATDQLFPAAPDLVPTGSTENNFGVFYDLGIQEAAWQRMAQDLSGKYLNPNGVSDTAGIKYDASTTGPVNAGCYELAYVPLSWYEPQ